MPAPADTLLFHAIDAARVGAVQGADALSIRSLTVRRTVLAAALFLIVSPAFADDATDLNQVVVTASRTAQTQDQALAPVTVIDRADIERLQPVSIVALLQGSAGIQLTNTGGPGKATSIFMRGTNADQVLVLVDGVKIGSATSGTPAIQDIPLEQIERIEIVRGPFSSLYGSEAVGGVIQIFTRRPDGAFVPHASFGVGSYDTLKGSVGAAGKQGAGWYSMEVSHDQTHGFNACRGPGGCFTIEPDNDGYKNDALTLQGGYTFNDQWDADARFFDARGRNQYDGSSSNSAKTESQVAGGRLHYKPIDRLTLTLALGQSKDFSSDYLDNVYTDTFNTRRKLGSLQADVNAGGGLYSVGFDLQHDQIQGSTDYVINRRTDRGGFGQWQQTFGSQQWQASVRRDNDSQFGGRNTGSLLWGWDFTRSLRLTASYGTAFHAPTFNELYYPNFGNPDLKPERSRSGELGLRGTHGWGGWSLNAYETRVNDLVAFTGPNFLPINVDRARIRGMEATAHTELAGWAVQGTLNWLDPRDESNGFDHGNLLPRRARQTARFDLDKKIGDFSVGGSYFVSGKRFDDTENETRLGGYSLTDLRVAYALDRDWRLQFSANNIFDKRYETAAFFNQPRRNYMLTVRWQPAQ